MKRLVAVLVVSGVLYSMSAPSLARPRNTMDWGPSSLRLSEGMTEGQAIEAIGYRPSKAELDTCGTKAASGPWTCRILTFGDSFNNLTVFERDNADDGDQAVGLHQWIVNHWLVAP
jgi:hypothetical protein